jgi:hypothetical protein
LGIFENLSAGCDFGSTLGFGWFLLGFPVGLEVLSALEAEMEKVIGSLRVIETINWFAFLRYS